MVPALLIAAWANPGIFSVALSLAVWPRSVAFEATVPAAFWTAGCPATRWLSFLTCS
jgi:hypothetical protein